MSTPLSMCREEISPCLSMSFRIFIFLSISLDSHSCLSNVCHSAYCYMSLYLEVLLSFLSLAIYLNLFQFIPWFFRVIYNAKYHGREEGRRRKKMGGGEKEKKDRRGELIENTIVTPMTLILPRITDLFKRQWYENVKWNHISCVKPCDI